jgi:hypothetical protein
MERPSDEQLRALIAQHKSVEGVHAACEGVSRRTVREWYKDFERPSRQGRIPEGTAIDDPQRLRIDQLQTEIKTLRRENGEYAKALASQEQWVQRMADAAARPTKTVLFSQRKAAARLPKRSIVLPIYDQQFGQLVRMSDTPGGKGHFNTGVFDTRLKRWVDGVTSSIRLQALGYRMDELVVVFGGDHVEGDEIFAGQPWQLELDPCRQVIELADKMTDAMAEIVRFAREEVGVNRIGFYGTVGNHGKVGGKKSGARPATYNWDWLFLEILFRQMEGHPVDEFVIEPSGFLVYAAGWEFLCTHGDNIKGWGGIPFYGISRHDSRAVRLHNVLYRYHLMGHIHQPAEITVGTGAETIVSGDWVGANNLSGVITAASRPQQKVIYVAEKWGVSSTERIYLTDTDAALEPSPVYGLSAA